MARPGVEVLNVDSIPPASLPTDTGVWFVCGITDKGSVTAPVEVVSMTAFEREYGPRTTTGTLYDSMETFFREGGSAAYVSRVVGPAAAISDVTLNDSQGIPEPTLDVAAKSPGAWGDSLTVDVIADGSDYRIIVYDETVEVERSTALTTAQDAVDWSEASEWVNIVLNAASSELPPAVTVSPAALTGGADDLSNITTTEWDAALALFDPELGPGQVSFPTIATSDAYTSLTGHAETHNRIALLDSTNESSASALAAEGVALAGSGEGERRSGLFGSWCSIPGILAGTTRTVPPCALTAGLIARNDSTGSPNRAPAGENGICRYVLGPVYTFTADEHETLNEAGVNVVRVIAGQPRLYGFRSLSPTTGLWWQLTNARLRMAVEAQGRAVAEGYLFRQIDGRGHLLSEFAGQLSGMLMGFYTLDSLFGDTPSEAFRVDVGPAVNTVETLADGEIHAVIVIRIAPFAELVVIEIVRASITTTIAA